MSDDRALFRPLPAGDGCAVNKSEGELLSPRTGCFAYTASCLIKRMASSKTICVEKVVTFASGIRPIFRHFQLSGKSTCFLNDVLETINVKEVKLMTWCSTRMANLLDSCATTVGLLFLLCYDLASCDLKQEERAYFMYPLFLGILHLLADW